ncbi:hypothetical protein [Acidocella sp. C78]|nr:hypothetical protein [Acidocella sp. C78]
MVLGEDSAVWKSGPRNVKIRGRLRVLRKSDFGSYRHIEFVADLAIEY